MKPKRPNVTLREFSTPFLIRASNCVSMAGIMIFTNLVFIVIHCDSGCIMVENNMSYYIV